MATVYLGLGTNIGDRNNNLTRALREISRSARVRDVSHVYESAPVGYADQDTFWNIAVRASTSLPPRELLVKLKEIEARMGRTPTFANGPRLIDIDILFYGDTVMSDGALTIPHPRAVQRAFVLRPLAEIATDLTEPTSRRRITEFLADVADQDATALFPLGVTI